MAIIKCKMCGGDLNIAEGSTVAECEYCGSVQTVPTVDHEKKLTLFGRANRLRLACEFDKAAGVYESIVAEFPEEAEAYWGLVLCRYGIEYVDDPRSGKKIPTCHRSSFVSIMEDSDFEQTLENADVMARKVYREEAKVIEELRKGILEVSGKEEPYDIFICYKETDEKGDRTIDSVIAQDVYDALVEKGYRVFFSRISLEDKLGTEYEPYIFAALNSAKVMLAFGTDYEYYNAVWVKNEWSRFLDLITAGQKKALIPCYKGIDAYDMPKEFARLQAQDMGKVGAIQDLLRGIDKIMGKGATERLQEAVTAQGNSVRSNTEALLKRGNMALEDGKWNDAKGFFDRVLDIDPELARAYLGIAMACAECRTQEAFRERYTSLAWEADSYTLRAKQYATADIKKMFEHWDVEKAEKAEKAANEVARRAEFYYKRGALAAKRICCGYSPTGYYVGVDTDGSVVAVGDNMCGQCNVSNWMDIVAIAAGLEHTIGLRADGTVVAAGSDEYGQCNVSNWTNIVAIAAGGHRTVGLKSDGTVVAVGDNRKGQCSVNDWTNIVAIAASYGCTAGLKADGTVTVVGDNEDGECNISDWTDIVAIAAGGYCTVGLKSDGTVVAVGENRKGQCSVSNWTDIVAIAAGVLHTVGLKADGTVVAVGDNGKGQCNVVGWSDIVAIATGANTTIALKVDGTVVSTYDTNLFRDWRLFNHIDTLEQEIAQGNERRRSSLECEKSALCTELNGLKGLFANMRRREIEARLFQIESELEKL